MLFEPSTRSPRIPNGTPSKKKVKDTPLERSPCKEKETLKGEHRKIAEQETNIV